MSSQWIPIERLDWFVKVTLAQGVIFLFLLLNIVSFSLPHAGDFKPFFLLMAVYYWAIYRPTLMPPAYTFALGIVMDLESGLPVGLHALVLVGLQILVVRQRIFLTGQPYITVWIGFAVCALAYVLLLWLAASLAVWALMPLQAPLIAMGFSIVLFPLISLILLGVHRILPLPSASYIR